MGTDGGDRFAHHAAAVARDLFGEENRQHSTKENLRFGTHGSMSVDVKTGQFYDHQEGEGGGVLWAIEKVTGQTVAGGKAIEWMRQNGYDVEDSNPPPRPAQNGGGSRLDPNGNWLPQRVPDHGRLTKTYDYRDANGDLVYQVCRYDWTVDPEVNPKGHDKTFVQRRPDASKKNGWAYKMQGVEWLPYRLPELLEDIKGGYPIFIVEGEKKVDMLRDELGVPATCNHGGAGKFPNDLAKWFEGADVIVMPDNDEPGQKHADLVGRRLEDTAKRVRILEIPDLPPKGGVDDWIPAGGTAEKLYDLMDERARPFEAQPFASKFGAVSWLDIDAPGPSHEYLIKGVLTKGEQSMLLGESQSGKSFLAVEMAMCVCRGVDFFGKRTKQGGVIYQAGESAVGIRRRRLPAYRQHYDVANTPLPFVLLEKPLDLYTSDEDTEAFIEECRHWSKAMPVPVELIVIDTFNKATPGANENDGKDMGMVLARCDRIRRETGAHVMLVHHLNAGGTKARGHTSLFANVENVITVKRVEDSHDRDNRQIREWKIAKQKEGEDGGVTKFVLKGVQIGEDFDGDPITSCIVIKPNGGEAPETDFPDGVSVGGVNGVVLRAVYNAVRHKGVTPPQEVSAKPGALAVEREDLWSEIKSQMPIDPTDKKDGESDEDAAKRLNANRRQQVKRALDYLYQKEIIGRHDAWTWLTGRKVRGFEPAPGLGEERARDERMRREDESLPMKADAPPPDMDLPFDMEEFK